MAPHLALEARLDGAAQSLAIPCLGRSFEKPGAAANDVGLRIRHNQHASDAAIARAERCFGGERFEPTYVNLWMDEYAPEAPDPAAPAVLPDGVLGQGDQDQLYRMADGSLGVAGPTCASGGSCGCDLGIGYVYLRRPDGHVAVVRLQPRLKTYVREVDACGYGCGQPPPPRPTVVAGLGVTDRRRSRSSRSRSGSSAWSSTATTRSRGRDRRATPGGARGSDRACACSCH